MAFRSAYRHLSCKWKMCPKKSEPWSSKVTYRFSIDVIKAAPVWSSYHGTSLTSVQPPKGEKKAVAVTKSVRGTCVKGERAGFYQDSLSLFSGSRFMFLNLNLWSLSLWSEMGLGWVGATGSKRATLSWTALDIIVATTWQLPVHWCF